MRRRPGLAASLVRLSRGRLLRQLLPVFVFIVLAGATILASRWQADVQAKAEHESLLQDAAAVTSDIRERLRLHGQFLRSLHAFASTPGGRELENWRQYARAIAPEKNLHGLFAFAYAPAIPADETGPFVSAMRRNTDRGTFGIFPLEAGKLSAPAIFIAPENALSQSAIGFNLLSDPARREAIASSLERQSIALSRPVSLRVSGQRQHPGFLIVQAVENPLQGGLAGVVICAYQSDEFFSAFWQSSTSRLALRIYDDTTGEVEAAPLLIHDSDPELLTRKQRHLFQHEIDFGGRTWLLHFTPRLDEETGRLSDPAHLILFGGLVASLLLALLLYHLTTRGERAERYAQSLTLELSRHRDQLQSLVEERTARLGKALEEARAADQAKSEFLANMSHELRTPMHAILSFAELAQLRLAAGQNDKLPGFLARIQESARRLLDLINELLDLAKLEAGHAHFQPEPLDLHAALDDAQARLESLLLDRQLHVEFDNRATQTRIVGDPGRLQQVFCNLLSNAIKFSPPESRLNIILRDSSLPMGRRNSDSGLGPAICVEFHDQGPGIPADELESIFDKFVQSSTTRTGAGGTGLGLAICREIVSHHHGTIVASNNPRGGACLTVTLPLNWQNGLVANG